MSAPNPTHIDVIADHGLQKWHVYIDVTHIPRLRAVCWCGHTVEVESPQSNVNAARRLLGAHVASKLTDAGYSIVQSAGAIELAQIVKELAYLTNQNQEFRDFYFGTYANSDRWQALQERALAAAAAEGEKP